MSIEETLPQLVVVGASAGGVEALSVLVGTLPEGFSVPIVVAQHLDPKRPSHLGEILGRRGPLPVRTVTAQERLEPGVVYVVPADRDVEVTDGDVRVVPDAAGSRARGGRRAGTQSNPQPPPAGGPAPSIDRLLRSAAVAYGEGLIAVILTGSGADGASGAHDVHQDGGTVIIQNPATARFPAMPQSLAPTTVDFVAELEAIGPLLHELVSGTRRVRVPEGDRRLRALLAQLRERSGIDFTGYKLPTVMRRLQRRMVATKTHSLPDYLRYLQRHPEEYQRLAGSFLIKVTGFFRDPDLYRAIRERVLPELLADARARGHELRLWSAGCATGEEAYSLAILVAEALGEDLERFAVRVFATDLDAEAVAFARRGVYPAAAVADVPAKLLERYFTEHDGEYTVRKQVRVLTVFGQHDLGQRAPFPRIDLALCRNVLIYFTPDLQRRALQLFAFALREGGYLALGKAETITPLAEFFVVADARLKLFRRQGGQPMAIPGTRIRDVSPLVPVHGGLTPAPGPSGPPALRASGVALEREGSGARVSVGSAVRSGRPALRGRRPAERTAGLLLQLPMGVIVVDRRYDIQVINTAARRLLGIHSAAVGEDLVHLARGVAAADLREALDAALRAEGPGVAKQLVTEDPARSGAALQLDAFPYGPVADGEPLALLLVSDVTATVQARRQAEQLAGRVREVSETNRQLLEANRELIEANADLLTENEELLVGQEEAEAATEEVETLNEELQATNEEQETLNEELQATVEELNTTNDDLQARGQELQATAVALEAERSQLQAILGGMGDAVLVLDASGEPVLTNASYDRLLGAPRAPLAPEDEQGQPLPPEMGFAERARRGETYSMQFTLTSEDGSRRWFEARGQPVRIETGERGSVVTVRDVTDRSLRRLQEQFVAMASHELRTPLAALTGFLQLLLRQRAGEDPEGRRKRQTELALAQARRLNVLVDDLLDVARLESGRMRLATERVDLRALVADAVEVVQPLAQDQAVRLDASAAGDGPLWVRGDPRRLQQALMNLLTNAIAYAPGTPTIDVRLRRVLSSLETPPSPDAPGEPAPATPKETATDSAPGWAEVDVQDYGPGISEADVPQLFTRFYRVAREDRASPPGLGLGLFIANEIVAAHRGRIEVHTVPGAGATFTIRLPLLPEEGAAADEGPDAPASTAEEDDGRP